MLSWLIDFDDVISKIKWNKNYLIGIKKPCHLEKKKEKVNYTDTPDIWWNSRYTLFSTNDILLQNFQNNSHSSPKMKWNVICWK